MEKKVNILSGISYKKGYKYVWDEATNFIFYQNNNGNLIMGLSSHAGKVSEDEIKKLYEISLKSFNIKFFGSGHSVELGNTIYLENFYSIADNEEAKNKIYKTINGLIPYFANYNEKELNENDKIEFSKELKIDAPYNGSTDDNPVYWTFDRDDHESIASVVRNIMGDILECLYDIGITREFYFSYNDEYREDCSNRDLSRVIEYRFASNIFDVVEDREEIIANIYDSASKDNIMYNECINYLNDFVEKLVEDDVTPADKIKASECAMIYQSITGVPYKFQDHINNVISDSVTRSK